MSSRSERDGRWLSAMMIPEAIVTVRADPYSSWPRAQPTEPYSPSLV